MVAVANRGHTQAHVARRPSTHRLARDHLQLHLRHAPLRAAQGPDRLPAPRPEQTHARLARGRSQGRQLPEVLSIHVRPPEANDRAFPGHWEGDLIKGAGNRSAVGVLVERSSRLVMLAKLADATTASALEGFTAKLRSIAEPMRQTLTYDQGKEMARHAELSANTGIKVYFFDPHSPWQRGSCENINGLIRQYLPKGTDLSVHSQEQLDAIADQLNNRIRAIHGFYPPISVYQAMLEKISQPHSSIQ